MTVQDMFVRIWQASGEPTDLTPWLTYNTTFDTTFTNLSTRQLAGYVNMACSRIAGWEYGDGTILRLPSLRKMKMFRHPAALSQSIKSATASTFVIVGFGGASLNRVDQFVGWVAEITAGLGVGQKRLVTATTGALAVDCTATVHVDWVTVPDATSTVSLYKSFVKLNTSQQAGSVDDYHFNGLDPKYINDLLAIRDLTALSDLGSPVRGELFTANLLTKGIPTQYRWDGDEIVFDVPFDGKRAFQLDYYANPNLIASGSDILDIPAAYHEAVCLWAVRAIQMREQDFNGAYASKRDLQELMQTLRMPGELGLDTQMTGVTVY